MVRSKVLTTVVLVAVVALVILMFARDINPRACVNAMYADDAFAEVC